MSQSVQTANRRQPPKLSRHAASGQYVVNHQRRTVYFGRDEAQAKLKYAEWVEQLCRETNIRPPVPSVSEAAERFKATVQADLGKEGIAYYTFNLRPLIRLYGDLPIDSLTPQDLLNLRLTLAERIRKGDLRIKTCNHIIGATKRLMKHAMAMEWRPAMFLDHIRAFKEEAVIRKDWSLAFIRDLIRKAERYQPAYYRGRESLHVWASLNYLLAARPSEIVTLVNGEGDWIEEGVFALAHSKCGKRSTMPRCLVFNKEAAELLPKAKPEWSSFNAYSKALRLATDHSAHPLRHSAATHLHRAGVDRQTVDIALGHYPSRVSLIYNPIDWRLVKTAMEKLTLR